MPNQPKCEYCEDLDKLDWECLDPDAPHHGLRTYCEECEAEYYEEYNSDRVAVNKQAKFNHPELKTY